MVIIGYSGSGKSVAIKHIVGLLEPDRGTVYVDDLEVPQLSRRDLYELRSKIGYVFQFAALFDSLSIGENVAMGLRKQGLLDPAGIRVRVAEALDLVDLPNVEDHFPAELSGGMRKRAALARALALDPDILFLDEPTAGLDPISAAAFDALIRDLQRALGLTVVIVTHDLDTLVTITDRIAVLVDGRVIVGTLAELLENDHPWIRQYFHGPRGRAARRAD
jgi:phospholipid/cholesterol/gamma-HCH transport system ATP-binding protein